LSSCFSAYFERFSVDSIQWFRQRACSLILLVLCLLLPASAVPADTSSYAHSTRQRPAFRPDRILVIPGKGLAKSSPVTTLLSAKHRVLRHFPEMDDWHVIQLDPTTTASDAIAEYRNSGQFVAVEPDYYVHAALAPNDPEYQHGLLWGLHNIGQNGGTTDADIDAPETWNYLTSAEDIIVAVVDSGIRTTHEDLADNLWVNTREIANNGKDDDRNGFIDDVHGINAMDDNGDLTDTMGHGTHIAGIIGATGNNGKGTVGVAWRVKIMTCKFLDEFGDGSVSDAIQCLDYARAKGADIVNISWVNADNSTALGSAFSKLRTAGILVAAAAGNGTQNIDGIPVYPPGYNFDNIITVTATTRTDALAGYANFGRTTVHLAAPGSDIYAPWRSGDQDYAYYNGTSMAAPFVAGALALLQAHNPQSTYKQRIQRLLDTVDPVPALADKCRTGGRLNLHRALANGLSAAFTAFPTNGPLPLSVAFRDDSVGSVSERRWDFGDGSPVSLEINPQHTYLREGDFTVTLIATDSNGSKSTNTTVITAVANYLMQSTNLAWIDPSAMPAILLADDGISEAQSIPFPFYYFGQRYEEVFVGANGLLGFSASGLESPNNSELPYSWVPNAVIAPYWDNLNPERGGSIRVGLHGQAPQRTLVISWINVPLQAYTNVAMTFQALLQENTQAVIFQYQEAHPEHNRGGGRRASVGLENQTGMVGQSYTINGTPALVTNQMALVFWPGSQERMSIGPTAPFVATGKSGGPFSPYHATYTLSNVGTQDLEWTVSGQPAWIALSSDHGVLAPGLVTNFLVTLTESAYSMGPGQYESSILIANQTTGLGNAVQSCILQITPSEPARLAIDYNSATNLLAIRLFGEALRSYELEGTSNLTQWATVGNQTTDIEGQTTFTNLNPPATPPQFYRSRQNPR
jgi:subtilisin family serine protease